MTRDQTGIFELADLGEPPHDLIRLLWSKPLHGGDKFMVPDTTIVRPGDGTKLDPPVIGFEGFHELGAV